MSISTHILDTALGRPAAGVAVSLARRTGADWTLLRESRTDLDGRVKSLLPGDYCVDAEGESFRLRFETAPYFAERRETSLYLYVDIVFQFAGTAHYHIPLLLTANGYTTYRGS